MTECGLVCRFKVWVLLHEFLRIVLKIGHQVMSMCHRQLHIAKVQVSWELALGNYLHRWCANEVRSFCWTWAHRSSVSWLWLTGNALKNQSWDPSRDNLADHRLLLEFLLQHTPLFSCLCWVVTRKVESRFKILSRIQHNNQLSTAKSCFISKSRSIFLEKHL